MADHDRIDRGNVEIINAIAVRVDRRSRRNRLKLDGRLDCACRFPRHGGRRKVSDRWRQVGGCVGSDLFMDIDRVDPGPVDIADSL